MLWILRNCFSLFVTHGRVYEKTVYHQNFSLLNVPLHLNCFDFCNHNDVCVSNLRNWTHLCQLYDILFIFMYKFLLFKAQKYSRLNEHDLTKHETFEKK